MTSRDPNDEAARIRRLRVTHGLTQVQLGELLDVSNVTVNRWEHGRARPNAAALRRIAQLERDGLPDAAYHEPDPMGESGALPVPLTSFVGRDREIATLAARLGDTRLLTLTGPGGCGKTRLAIAVARSVRPRFSGGVRWVDLAGLLDPELVPDVVARALNARHPVGRPPLERLTAACCGQRQLIVLDNCEHLQVACAALVEAILAVAPEVHVLATSRSRLGAGGEMVWPVPPLDLPEPASTDPDRVATSEALRLFIERARLRLPEIASTAQQVDAIAAICRRLDGLPLAIELAAARIPTLTTEQIVARLDDQFQLLRSDRVTAPPRQQTLRASFDWSYEMLTPLERTLFVRLTVFPGPFDLDAAEAIASGDPIVPGDVLDLLDGLVAQSILTVARSPKTDIARYALLNTLRTYGRERLTADDAFAVAERHAAYVADLAGAAARELRGSRQAIWLTRLDAAHDDLRAVLAWTIEQGRTAEAVRLGTALERFWTIRGDYAEGAQWLDRILGLIGDAPSPERAAASYTAGVLCHPLGAYKRAMERFETALNDWRMCEDRHGEARALDALGAMARRRGDFAGAAALHEQALALARELDDDFAIVESLTNLGIAAAFRSDYDKSAGCFREGLALAQRLGDRVAEKTLWNDLGDLAQRRGAARESVEPFERSLEIARELGDRDGIATALVNLAEVRSALGESDRAAALAAEGVHRLRSGGTRAFLAAALYVSGRILRDRDELDGALDAMREALAIYRELGDASGTAHSLEALAWLTIDAGDADQGARWLGTAAAARAALAIPTYDADAQTRAETAARSALGGDGYGRALAEGSALPLDNEIARAIATPSRPLSSHPPAGARGSPPGSVLTHRQREVLALVAAGCSNHEVGDALGISARTVEHHLAAIYAALRVERRAAAIAYAVANGLTSERAISAITSGAKLKRDDEPRSSC